MGTTSRLIAATVLAAATLAVPHAAPAAPGALAVTGRAVRIMPLGDSITYGVGSSTSSSYRTALWSRLVNHAGIAVDFVGSQKSGSLPDTDHEGHSGWRIDQLTAQIDGWLATSRPDVILLHIGTNDMNQNVDIANAPTRLGTLLDRIYADLPSVTVLVAAVVPAGDATVNARVNAFNAKLPAVVQKRADAGRAAHFVNLNATIGSADMNDGLHPNDAGYTKMASLWHSALEGVLANGRDWPLFRSGLEPGEFLPSWTNSVETSTNVGGYCCGLTGMES
jgi:lysophospholipase L1-like esterase